MAVSEKRKENPFCQKNRKLLKATSYRTALLVSPGTVQYWYYLSVIDEECVLMD
jgi:hypothetical protein